MMKRPQNACAQYHAHVYFDETSTEQARELWQNAATLFGVKMGRVHQKLVGPHPHWSRQLAFMRLIAGAGVALYTACAPAQQAWPNRPIRLIVPLAPGGTTDILARTMGPLLTAGLGQPVVVENRGGAGGVVGTDVVAKAAADGYTILLSSADTYNVNAGLFPKLPYDARKDLKPVSVLAASPNMLIVHSSLPVKSVGELVALSKVRPRDLSYAGCQEPACAGRIGRHRQLDRAGHGNPVA